MTTTTTVANPFTGSDVPLLLSLEPAVVPKIRLRSRSGIRRMLPASDFCRKAV